MKTKSPYNEISLILFSNVTTLDPENEGELRHENGITVYHSVPVPELLQNE